MIVYDTDTQKDFMNVDGALYVDGAETIVGAISKVMETAHKNDILVIGSVDAHPIDDKEFETFPPHCVVDTEGQEKIPETLIHNDSFIYTVPNTGNGLDMYVADGCGQIYFEKQTYNIWDKALGQPDNLQTILRSADVKDVYMIGVASNVCVIAAIEGFVERKYKVHVITDAIKGLTISEDNNEDTATDRMIELGVDFITSDEFEIFCKGE